MAEVWYSMASIKIVTAIRAPNPAQLPTFLLWPGQTKKVSLKRHIDSVNKQIKYPCNQCGLLLKGKEYLKKHIQTVHKKNQVFNVTTKQPDRMVTGLSEYIYSVSSWKIQGFL